MRKTLVGLIVVGCVIGFGVHFFWGGWPVPAMQVGAVGMSEVPLVTELADGPAPKEGAIVFEMGYRGLAGEEDEFSYNSFWGYGGGNEKTKFIKAVRKAAGEIATVYNPNFKGAEYSAVEYEEQTAKAFYFDLNANGKLDEGEKISPAGKKDQNNQTDFLTPDFAMTTRDGKKIPFRVLLRASFYGDSTKPNCMWSPSCVLEGSSKVGGNEMSLVLMTNGFSGSFVEFGRGYYSIKENGENKQRSVFRQNLSSLINYGGVFYRVRFLKSADNEGGMRTVLEKDTSETGEVAVKLSGNEGLKVRLNNARISGATDKTISFTVGGGKAITLPVGEYTIDSGYIYYGKESADECNVSFTEGPVVKVEAGKSMEVEIGKPKVQISAIDQKKRYSSNASEETVFKKGTTVFLSPKVRGMAGELYGRFSRQESKKRVDVEPTFEILDSGDKQIASGTMEYG